MATLVGIIGESGTGKTASLRNFNKEDVFVFSVSGKRLPFRNDWDNHIFNNATYTTIEKTMKKAASNPDNKIKTFVIDDSQYLMAYELFAHCREAGYNKFTMLAKNFQELLKFIREELPDDYIVYMLHHTEADALGRIKMKTIGKMLDEKLTIEGLFDIILLTHVDKSVYQFLTNNIDGASTCKTPIGMFEEAYIPNDLKYVDDTIREYYNIEKEAK